MALEGTDRMYLNLYVPRVTFEGVRLHSPASWPQGAFHSDPGNDHACVVQGIEQFVSDHQVSLITYEKEAEG